MIIPVQFLLECEIFHTDVVKEVKARIFFQ